MKLNDIKAGQLLAGVVPGKLVRVVGAELRGEQGLELAYRVDGTVGQRRLTKSDEDGVVLARPTIALPKLSFPILAGVVVLFCLVAFVRLWPRHHSEGGIGSNDVPVVIRTNGGMLEVATLNHRRTFSLTDVLVVAGIEVPFCKATASYTVDASFTYRVRLAKKWGARYRNGRLEVTAPRLEPALPVAWDTRGLSAALRKCPAMPGDTKQDLLKRISGKLEAEAMRPEYLHAAREGTGAGGARETVREFVQKWLVTQKGYDIPPTAPIDVEFADE